jgi:uncharacterized protein (UPF0276 family)
MIPSTKEIAMTDHVPTAPALTSTSVGVGLKHEHADDALSGMHAIDFFEVHAENYMGDGGPPHHFLREVRSRYPLSLHGVGLSIGAAGRLDPAHLARLRRLVDHYQPCRFSEHLAWSTHAGRFLNDLLPLPYTKETLAWVCEHIDTVQEMLRIRMLLENLATYVAFEGSTMSEVEFLRCVVARTFIRGLAAGKTLEESVEIATAAESLAVLVSSRIVIGFGDNVHSLRQH